MNGEWHHHVPVLLDAAIARLQPISGTWVDCTLGAGGYAIALLEQGADHVIGIDRDPVACGIAAANLAERRGDCTIVNDSFGKLDTLAEVVAAGRVEGVIFDLGVSSMQLLSAERGFSFSRNGPLDMRMGKGGMSAADVVNNETEQGLARILREYGEEPDAFRIARRIVRQRQKAPLETTAVLAELVENCLHHRKRGSTHKATRTFQALRMHVNDELGELETGLKAAAHILAPGGKLAVITFHSLEDRIVKHFMQPVHRSNRHSPDQVTRECSLVPFCKPVRPDASELENNPRSRSARLRIAVHEDRGARGRGRFRPGNMINSMVFV